MNGFDLYVILIFITFFFLMEKNSCDRIKNFAINAKSLMVINKIWLFLEKNFQGEIILEDVFKRYIV